MDFILSFNNGKRFPKHATGVLRPLYIFVAFMFIAATPVGAKSLFTFVFSNLSVGTKVFCRETGTVFLLKMILPILYFLLGIYEESQLEQVKKKTSFNKFFDQS